LTVTGISLATMTGISFTIISAIQGGIAAVGGTLLAVVLAFCLGIALMSMTAVTFVWAGLSFSRLVVRWVSGLPTPSSNYTRYATYTYPVASVPMSTTSGAKVEEFRRPGDLAPATQMASTSYPVAPQELSTSSLTSPPAVHSGTSVVSSAVV
jgi:hypothetical protein